MIPCNLCGKIIRRVPKGGNKYNRRFCSHSHSSVFYNVLKFPLRRSITWLNQDKKRGDGEKCEKGKGLINDH